jgi:hypothetical protein
VIRSSDIGKTISECEAAEAEQIAAEDGSDVEAEEDYSILSRRSQATLNLGNPR